MSKRLVCLLAAVLIPLLEIALVLGLVWESGLWLFPTPAALVAWFALCIVATLALVPFAFGEAERHWLTWAGAAILAPPLATGYLAWRAAARTFE